MADLTSILADPNYINANEATKTAIFEKFAAQDPNFTSANPETQAAIRNKFGVPALTFETTEGGAATGNPLAARKYGGPKDTSRLDPLTSIGGAAVGGAYMGALAPEILQGLSVATRGVPALAPLSTGLNIMAQGTRQAGRTVSSIAGGVSGLASETSGQIAEGMGASAPVAEAARLVGGAVTPELGPLALQLARFTVSGAPQQAAISFAKSVLAKIQSGQATPAEQKQFLEIQSRIMGEQEPGKALKIIGDEMEQAALNIRSTAARKASALHSDAADVSRAARLAADAELAKVPGKQADIQAQQAYLKTLQTQVKNAGEGTVAAIGEPKSFSVIGSELQQAAAKRQNELQEAASAAYKETQKEVNSIVAKLEGVGRSVTDLSSYKTLVARLQQELKPGVHSPDVARGYQKILDQITVARGGAAPVTFQPSPAGGVVSTSGLAQPSAKPTFQAIDDARRLLGEAFRGEADEGYKAIGNTAQKEFYSLVSQVQKDFAGEPQSKLLTQYADSRPGLEIFGSKAGTKLTGLDKGALSQFASDPSNIPKVFFSTPKMFASLVDLVGDKALALQAAQQYTANELTLRKTSREVGSWMTKNREFLNAVPEIKTSVIAYQNSLQNSEREIANIGAKIQKLGSESKATATTASASARQMLAEGRATSQTLTKEAGTVTSESAALADKLWNGRPGELKNAREAIEGGDFTRWAAIAPVIERSPEAKTAIFNAVRQVTSELATNTAVIKKFNEQMRPALERFGMLSKDEADRIAAELAKIGEKSGSEAQKLGLMRRLILQGVAGYSSSLTSRGINYTAISLVDQIPKSSGALGGPIAPPPPKKEGMLSRSTQ
jgi:hypothetical protein